MFNKKKEKRTYFISTRRVNLSALLHALLSGILLFLLLMLIFSVKMVRNGRETVDRIEKAVEDTMMNQMSSEGEFDYRYIAILDYLNFLHGSTDETYQELVDFAKEYYPYSSPLVMGADGKVLTITPEALEKYRITEAFLFDILSNAETNVINMTECNVYYSKTDENDYFVMFIDGDENVLSTEIITPLEAIQSVMSNNDIGHNNDNHAYLRFNKTGAVYTEDGLFSDSDVPEFLKDRFELQHKEDMRNEEE